MALKFAGVTSLIFALVMAQAPPMQAQAQAEAIGNIFTVVQVIISGLRNTVTGLPFANSTSPIFSGALAQIRIGTRPVAVGITGSTGSVNITLSPTLLLTTPTNLVNNLINKGTLRTLTPVLNQTTGLLTAPLELVGNITRGFLTIINLHPSVFTLTV